LIVLGCAPKTDQPASERVPVARVFEEYLYLDQLDSLIPQGTSEADSADRVRQYIDRWARDRILLARAEYNLSDREKDFEKLLRDYRNDLLRYNYQQAMLRQYLDTLVTDEQIDAFYKDHRADFALKENIVRADWMVLSNRTPKMNLAKKWFFSKNEADQRRILDYALQYSTRYSLADTQWVRFSDLATYIPLRTYNQEQFLQNNRSVELSDSSQTYWLAIREYRKVDGTSPISYVRETVKSMLLNERKQALILNIEQDLLEEALKQDDYELFER
jgi:hypothetical protein